MATEKFLYLLTEEKKRQFLQANNPDGVDGVDGVDGGTQQEL